MLFNEFIQKNPTFWTDNFPTLPSVVTSVIEDWFYYRELCSEKRFNVYFRAKMNVKLDEFLTLYNKELEFRGLDPYQIEKIDKTINTIKNNSIEDILQSIRNFESSRLETRDVTNLNTKALKDKTTLDLTNTNTKDLTNTETLNTEDNLVKTGTETTANNNTYSNTDTKSGSDTSETANTGTTTTKNTGTTTNVDTGTTSASNKFSDYPQSDLNTLTDYLSNQSNVSETYEKNSSNTDDTQTLVTLNTNVDNTASYNSSIATTGSEEKSQTVTNNLTDKTTKTGTVTNKQTGTDVNAQTGTNTVDKTGTDTNKETGTVNNTDNSTSNLNSANNKIENGTIDIVLSQLKTGNFLDLYRKYFTIVTTFNSVDWLLKELDVCFIQVFDEEDEEYSESSSDLEEKIEDLQVQVNELDTRVTYQIAAVNTDINALDNDLQQTNVQLNNITNNLTSLTEVVSTNTDNISALTTKTEDNTERIAKLEDGGSGGTVDVATIQKYTNLQPISLLTQKAIATFTYNSTEYDIVMKSPQINLAILATNNVDYLVYFNNPIITDICDKGTTNKHIFDTNPFKGVYKIKMNKSNDYDIQVRDLYIASPLSGKTLNKIPIMINATFNDTVGGGFIFGSSSISFNTSPTITDDVYKYKVKFGSNIQISSEQQINKYQIIAMGGF